MRCQVIAALGLAAIVTLPAQALAAPKVVASIKPVHSLVAAVMGETGTPTLIIEGAGSPHSYSLRPSQASAIAEADLVFWVGNSLETFLEKPLTTLADDKARAIALSQIDGLTVYDLREGGAWEAHKHEDDGHGHDHEHGDHAHEAGNDHGHEDHAHEAGHDHDHEDHAHEAGHEHEHEDHAHEAGHEHDDGHHADHHAIDSHVWLDPRNAAVMTDAIAAALAEADPANADTYAANADALKDRLGALESDLDDRLAPVREKPYIVFHDGYQYFERRFGLDAIGSITVSPEQRPGAARLKEMRDRLAESGAVCVFAEPQFEPSLVATVIEGTNTRSGVLDPLGAEIPAGPQAYETLLTTMADDLVSCLAPAATE